MKKLILAGIAVLSLSSASATQPQRSTLPDTIIGNWCHHDNADMWIKEHREIYTRSYNPEDCSDYHLVITQEGYGEMWDECVFNKIEQEARDTYLVHTRCEAQAEGEKVGIGIFWEENLEYQIVNGQLVVTTIPGG